MSQDTYQSIAAELIELAGSDQATRLLAAHDRFAWGASLDEAHQRRLGAIIDEIG